MSFGPRLHPGWQKLHVHPGNQHTVHVLEFQVGQLVSKKVLSSQVWQAFQQSTKKHCVGGLGNWIQGYFRQPNVIKHL